jgi:rhomboid family GlyGly-CTERM serine protease
MGAHDINARTGARGLARLAASLNCDGRRGLWLLAACALLLAPQLGGEPLRLALRYERAAIAAGEWWRLLSAHFVHLDPEHALLNALGLALMWALFARDFTPARWGMIVMTSIAAIDAGFWFRNPQLEWYVGASGVLHGMMVAGTLAHVRRRDLDGWILVAFLVVKFAYEQGSGALPFAAPDARVVVDAHLYGALGGLAAALGLRSRSEPL